MMQRLVNLVTGAEPELEPKPNSDSDARDAPTQTDIDERNAPPRPDTNPDPTPDAPGADEQKARANVNPNSPGCEGCFANALHFFGAFGGRLTDVKQALNAQIDAVHADFVAKNKDASRDQAGREDEYWHTNVALKAFKVHYDKFTFKKLKCVNLDNPDVYKRDKNYIVDGVLAPHFQDPTDGKRIVFDDYRTFHEDDPSWRHCAGLMSTGRSDPTHYVLSKGLPGNYDSIAVLHLGSPRTSLCKNEKFFWRINKVYELSLPNMRVKPRPPPRPRVESASRKARKRKTKSKTPNKKQKKPKTLTSNTPEPATV